MAYARSLNARESIYTTLQQGQIMYRQTEVCRYEATSDPENFRLVMSSRLQQSSQVFLL